MPAPKTPRRDVAKLVATSTPPVETSIPTGPVVETGAAEPAAPVEAGVTAEAAALETIPLAVADAVAAAPVAVEPVVETAPAIRKDAPMDTNFAKTADTFGAAKDAFEKSKDQFEKINATAVKGFDELAALTKGNVEAVFASANVAIKGAEEIGRAWYAYTQSVSEQGASVARSILGAKTFREVVDLQAGYAKSTFDGLVAESTKISGARPQGDQRGDGADHRARQRRGREVLEAPRRLIRPSSDFAARPGDGSRRAFFMRGRRSRATGRPQAPGARRGADRRRGPAGGPRRAARPGGGCRRGARPCRCRGDGPASGRSPAPQPASRRRSTAARGRPSRRISTVSADCVAWSSTPSDTGKKSSMTGLASWRICAISAVTTLLHRHETSRGAADRREITRQAVAAAPVSWMKRAATAAAACAIARPSVSKASDKRGRVEIAGRENTLLVEDDEWIVGRRIQLRTRRWRWRVRANRSSAA